MKLSLPDELWAFSLQQWQEETRRAVLMRLQDDHGLCVNELLLAMFAARQGQRPDWHQVGASMRVYKELVEPLRAARVAAGGHGDFTAELHQHLKQQELEAERIHQRLLCEELMASGSDQSPDPESARTNLEALLAARLEPADQRRAAGLLGGLL